MVRDIVGGGCWLSWASKPTYCPSWILKYFADAILQTGYATNERPCAFLQQISIHQTNITPTPGTTDAITAAHRSDINTTKV